LLRSSDTFLAFVCREVEYVVSDQSQTDRQIIARLWEVLYDSHLTKSSSLDGGKLADPGARCDLIEQFKLFFTHAIERGIAGCARKAGDEANANRVDHSRKFDGYGSGTSSRP
jgi:hypothetical protein